jgi:hypothetical protein
MQRPTRYCDRKEIKDFVLFNINHNPRGLMKVLHSEGFVSPRTRDELVVATVNYIEADKLDAIKKIIDVHPHWNYILERAIETGEVKPIGAIRNNIDLSNLERETVNEMGNNKTSRVLNVETDSNGNNIITQELIKGTRRTQLIIMLVAVVALFIYINK